MADINDKIGVADIEEFVDGVLGTDREANVMAAVSKDPELSTKLHAYQYQNAGFRALYDPLLEEPVPERLLQVLSTTPPASARPTGWRPALLKAAVLACVFIVGAAAGIGGHPILFDEKSLLQPVIKQAVLAHQLLEAQNSDSQELINEAGGIIDSNQVSAEFGVPLRLPTTASFDSFVPVSVRSTSGTSSPVAQIMYEDARGQDISLYIRSNLAAGAIPFDGTQYDGYDVIYWIDGPLVYVLVGQNIEIDELARMARVVYSSQALTINEVKPALEIKSSKPPVMLPAQQNQSQQN